MQPNGVTSNISTDSSKAAGIWLSKLRAADTRYESWEKRFECGTLEDYFEGYQYRGDESVALELRRYVINLIFSSVETKIPTTAITRPIYQLSARPYKDDFDSTYAFKKCQLQEDVLNSFILDRKNQFSELIEQCSYDIFFRFAVVETGYEADYISNPKAGRPILDEEEMHWADEDIKVLKQPEVLPENEKVFVKRINPRTFRIGGRDSRSIEKTQWCGYFEYIPIAELKATKGLQNLDKITSSPSERYGTSFYGSDFSNDPNIESPAICKIWHIWHNDLKVKLVIDGGSGYTLKARPFEKLPLNFFGPIPRAKVESIYPVPVAFNWLFPQIEVNEGREALRAHRRKFSRKYLLRKGTFSNEGEFEKLLIGPDGTFAETEEDPTTSVAPLPQAPMDQAAREAAIVSKDDFNLISATSNEDLLNPERTTATQATIVQQKGQLRQNRSRELFLRFLTDIGCQILRAHAKIVNPFFVKRFVDSPQSLFTEFPELQFTWQQILSEEIEGDDYDINIDITSLSAEANEEEKKKFFELMAALAQYPQMAYTPVLIEELMNRLNYRNYKVRQALLQMATMQVIGAATQMQQQNQMAQQQMAKSTPNTQERTQNQVRGKPK